MASAGWEEEESRSELDIENDTDISIDNVATRHEQEILHLRPHDTPKSGVLAPNEADVKSPNRSRKRTKDVGTKCQSETDASSSKVRVMTPHRDVTAVGNTDQISPTCEAACPLKKDAKDLSGAYVTRRADTRHAGISHERRYPEVNGTPDVVDAGPGAHPKHPVHPEFSTVEARKKTFSSRWPHKKPTITALAKCGFFYGGRGDDAICYWCDLLLNCWDPDDDPQEEHRRFRVCPLAP